MVVLRDKSASLVEHLFLTNALVNPNLVTARDKSGTRTQEFELSACWNSRSVHRRDAKEKQGYPFVAPLLRTLAQRQGNGKGIQATVLVPITILVIEAKHYMEEDEVDV